MLYQRKVRIKRNFIRGRFQSKWLVDIAAQTTKCVWRQKGSKPLQYVINIFTKENNFIGAQTYLNFEKRKIDIFHKGNM